MHFAKMIGPTFGDSVGETGIKNLFNLLFYQYLYI